MVSIPASCHAGLRPDLTRPLVPKEPKLRIKWKGFLVVNRPIPHRSKSKPSLKTGALHPSLKGFQQVKFPQIYKLIIKNHKEKVTMNKYW